MSVQSCGSRVVGATLESSPDLECDRESDRAKVTSSFLDLSIYLLLLLFEALFLFIMQDNDASC